MELTPLRLPSGPYAMKVTSWNLHHGGYHMEGTPLKLRTATCTMEVT